jgi:hypothetical protein
VFHFLWIVFVFLLAGEFIRRYSRSNLEIFTQLTCTEVGLEGYLDKYLSPVDTSQDLSQVHMLLFQGESLFTLGRLLLQTEFSETILVALCTRGILPGKIVRIAIPE